VDGQPADFWGKLRRSEEGGLAAWHPLADHCADVAACLAGLLRKTLLRHRLARLARLSDLTPIQVARLGVLAALHDIGKFNLGFQYKAKERPPFTNGHVREVLALFDDAGYRETEALIDALSFPELTAWGEEKETAVAQLLVATISHHGRPQPVGSGHQPIRWQAAGDLDPFAGIHGLMESTRRWFPEAFEPGGDLLPAAPPFQHAFCGLVTLADWMGSDTHLFPFSEPSDGDRFAFAQRRAAEALARLGLDVTEPRAFLGSALPTFQQISPFAPRRPQRSLLDLPTPRAGSMVVLEAETGSGKTEAALIRFLRLFHAGVVDGLYFALPTRPAATQIHRRVAEAMQRAFPNEEERPPVVLAVPGYITVDDRTATRLPGFEVLWNDDDRERWRYRGWAAEHPKRYLAGAVVVGTIDQVLLSALAVSHSAMRATALLRHLLIVDEVHASDAYMNRILEAVLQRHLQAGGHALLMSATLGSVARSRFLATATDERGAKPSLNEAIERPYPAIVHQEREGAPRWIPVAEGDGQKRVVVEIWPAIDAAHDVAARALAAARQGARVLVLRNTVGACVETQTALLDLASHPEDAALLFSCNGVPAPHHARFARQDRHALDDAIEARFGTQGTLTACVAVTTQTVQQSLDLDADLLITDLCPADVLLQRVGRLHRHQRNRPVGFEQPRVVVLTPAERDLGRLLRSDGTVHGTHGFGSVYDDLRVLEATWRILESHPLITIPAMNRELVEQTTHPDGLAQIVAELGEAWAQHANHVAGVGFADGRLASLNLASWRAPFGEQETLFPEGELSHRIQTRLGEGDRLAIFPDPPPGPFGNPIRTLTIPAYQSRDVPADAEPEEVEPDGAALCFRLGPHRFVYDAVGLRPVVTRADEGEDGADG